MSEFSLNNECKQSGQISGTSSGLSPRQRITQLINDGELDEARHEVINLIWHADLSIGSAVTSLRRRINDGFTVIPHQILEDYYNRERALMPIFDKVRELSNEIKKDKNFDITDVLNRFDKTMEQLNNAVYP